MPLVSLPSFGALSTNTKYGSHLQSGNYAALEAFYGEIMGITTTPVAKCLDKKLLIFGYEVPDVLAIFFTLSVLNFIFGQMPFKFLFIWLPTVALAFILRLGKRGKPDNFLIHWLRFQTKPGTYLAFPNATRWVRPPKLKILKGVQG